MSTSSNDRAPLGVETVTPVADGVLRAMDLSHPDVEIDALP